MKLKATLNFTTAAAGLSRRKKNILQKSTPSSRGRTGVEHEIAEETSDQ
jgi:hypothetical protein